MPTKKLTKKTTPKDSFQEITDPRYEDTEYVCEATSEELHNIWYKWCHIGGIPLEQDTMGHINTIGYIGDRPICVSVFWYKLYGKRIAFIEPTSQLVDWAMVDRWRTFAFTNVKSSANSANFHNIVYPLAEAAKIKVKMRDWRAVDDLIRKLPIEA